MERRRSKSPMVTPKVGMITTSSGVTVEKLGSSLVGILDGAIHPVTEAELAGQSEGQPPHTEAVIVRAECLDDAAVIISGEAAGDLVLETETLAEVGVLHAFNLHLRRRAQHWYRPYRPERGRSRVSEGRS